MGSFGANTAAQNIVLKIVLLKTYVNIRELSLAGSMARAYSILRATKKMTTGNAKNYHDTQDIPLVLHILARSVFVCLLGLNKRLLLLEITNTILDI